MLKLHYGCLPALTCFQKTNQCVLVEVDFYSGWIYIQTNLYRTNTFDVILNVEALKTRLCNSAFYV